MADPQTADQGFLAGLLGKFGADPAAAYGGLLSDPATQRQFALRSLGAAAQAFGQGAMPVPYKGGIPFGATLGAAGGAASTAGDELIKARLEQAQQQQALASVGLSHQQVTLMQAALPGLKSLIATGQDRLSGGTGTGTDGKPLTGPAKILAGNAAQGGGIGAGQLYGFLRSFDYPGVAPATPQEASFLTGNAKIESNFNPDTEHDAAFLAKKGLPPGYGLWGDNADRLAAMRKDSWVGPTDNVPWQQQAIWQLQELRKSGQGSAVNAAKSSQDLGNLSIDYLRPDTKQNDGFRAERRDAINTYLTNPPDAQTASTGDQPPAAAPGSQVGPYAPVPGQPPPQGVYVPPGASPNAPPVRIEGGPPAPAAPAAPPTAPPAASRGLLDTSQGPLGSSAAPPQLAIPPAAGAPGPVTGLLGQQPAQQVAAADAPQLSPAAAAILQGINRQQAGGGLLASGSVAGGNAVPTGGPSPAAVAQAGQPHTGAAGAAELAGLLAQQPAAAPPTATPYTSAPPVTGQGAQAPGPAPTGPPIAPPLNLPSIPTQMPTMPNLPAVQPTPQQQIAQGVAGLMALSGHPAPPWIDDLAKMPAQMAMEQYKAWVGGQANMMTEQYKKQIEVAAAGTISYLQSQGQLPADLTKMTTEQNLKLRNSMAEKGLEQKPDGSWGFMPGYVEQQGQLKKQEQDLQQQREIAVKNAEQTAIAQREQQNRDATLAQLPLQERQKALFTDYADNVQKPAGTADNARKTLAALGNSLSNFQTGAMSPQRLEIAKMWSDAVTTLGFTPSPAVRQMIASGETIGKEGNTLGFELAKELGSRESQMVIQAAIASNPGLAMSPQGNAQLIKLLDNGLQRDIAKKSFYDQYFTANHTYEGADTAFRKVNPVEVTVSSVPGLEYHPKTPQEVASYPSGTRYVRPDVPGQVFTVR